jgi:hypothetical protein
MFRFENSEKPDNDGNCSAVPLSSGETGNGGISDPKSGLDDAAAGTLAARYLNIAYDETGRVRDRHSLKQADNDLRDVLDGMGIALDRIEVEFQRVLNIVASDPNPGPRPDA